MTQPEPTEQDLDAQYRCPSGPLGLKIGYEMAGDHLPENLWTVSLLDPQPSDRILEVGFGPGVAIEVLSTLVTGGHITGIDLSHTMVTQAGNRNATAIEAGRVTLRHGDASSLPFADASFDKAFSIHSIYFWPDPLAALKELYRVLKPGGLLVITMLPKERWPANPPGSPLEHGTPECTPYSAPELQHLMHQAGFTSTRVQADPAREHRSNFSVLAREL